MTTPLMTYNKLAYPPQPWDRGMILDTTHISRITLWRRGLCTKDAWCRNVALRWVEENSPNSLRMGFYGILIEFLWDF